MATRGAPTRAMRVGLNLVYLVPGSTGGMETYARRLIPALRKASPETEFVAFLNNEAFGDGFAQEVGLQRAIRVPVSGRRRTEWVWGEQLLLPRLAKRSGVNLLHNLAWSGPLKPPCAMVTTTHDVAYAHSLESPWRLRTLGMRILLPRVARASARVIAVSQFSAGEIVRVARVPANRVTVVYEASDDPGRAPSRPRESTRDNLGINGRFVLIYPAAKRPHKNLERLFEAIARIPPSERPVVIVPGYSTPYENVLRERIRVLGIARDVRMLGWVSDDDLEGLYAASDAMIFPSLFEGFGLPVVEAFQRSLPVACSRIASLPEIVGDAALMFDPHDTSEICNAIRRLISEDETRHRLRAAGLDRSAIFSWAAAATETLAVYHEAKLEVAGSEGLFRR